MKKLLDINKMPNWAWPLPCKDKFLCSVFLDGFIGTNENYTDHQRNRFIGALSNSVSLDLAEKKRIIDLYSELTQFQLNELENVFLEELMKFQKLQEEHPDDLEKLLLDKFFDWCMLINPEAGEQVFLKKYSETLFEIDEKIILFFFNLLIKKEKYSAIYALSLSFLEKMKHNETQNLEFNTQLFNNYIYSAVYLKKIIKKEGDLYNKFHQEVLNSNIDNLYQDFLLYCLDNYIDDLYARSKPQTIIHYHFTTHRNLLKFSDILYVLSMNYFYDGQLEKATNAILKSIKRYSNKNEKINVENIFFLLFSEDNKDRNTQMLLTLLYLSNRSDYKELVSFVTQMSYEKLLSFEENTQNNISFETIIFLEIFCNERRISQRRFVKSGSTKYTLSQCQQMILDIHYDDGMNLYFVKLMVRELERQNGFSDTMRLFLVFILLIKSKVQTTSYQRILGNGLIDGLHEIINRNNYRANKNMFKMLKKSIYGDPIGKKDYFSRYLQKLEPEENEKEEK